MSELTDEMGEWFNLVGGSATMIEWYDVKGRKQYTKQVQFGQAKPSHRRLDGSSQTLIRFHGNDASTASMFLLKFIDSVVNHNMKEYQEYV